LIAGLFLVIGAMIAFLNGLRSDRAKFKREDAQRWGNELLTRSGAYLTALDIAFDQLKRSHRGQADLGNKDKAEQRKKAEELYYAAFPEIRRTRTELYLICPVFVRLSAMELVQVLQETHVAKGDPPADLSRKRTIATEKFSKMVRVAAGVPSFGPNKKKLMRALTDTEWNGYDF